MGNMILGNISPEDAFAALPELDLSFLDVETPEDEQKRKAANYKKIAKRYDANKVIIAEVVDTRENFAENKLIAVVEAPLKTDDFDGRKTEEAWINAGSAEGVATLSGTIYGGRMVVIDAKTRRIIEAC